MPISGDQYTDKNKQRYSLPMDSCVGDDGPEPTEVTNLSGPAKIPYAGAGSAPVGYDGP
jgi:hypothetical protein